MNSINLKKLLNTKKKKKVCVYEGESEGRKEKKAGGRKLGGGGGKEGRKEERQRGEIIKGERDRQGDRQGDLARLLPEAHTDQHMELHRIGTCSSGIGSELRVSKIQFLQLQNENTNFQPL